MSNFQIEFSNPWLLFVLIPALFLALYPHFRMAKRYRRTRNRITSVVLHTTLMVLAVFLLAGMNFSYHVPNKQNEIIVLVDTSVSNDEGRSDRDDFIYDLVRGKDPDVKMGVVTFGFGECVLTAPMSYDGVELYNSYIVAESPDQTATDVASALEYARTLITYPETSKIVLISDGLETDNQASRVIRSIAAEGIKVDTVYFSQETYENEVQLTGVTMPDENIVQGQEFEFTLSLKSSFEGNAQIVVFDNDEEQENSPVFRLREGEQTVLVKHTFTTGGMHDLRFNITGEYDTLTPNNTLHSYYYLEIFDDLLLVEREEGEARQLNDLLKENFNTTVINIADANLPQTVRALQDYDQVVLVNISNRDMPMNFITALNSYVKEVGGGLFTVGGDRVEDGKTIANAYNSYDIQGSFQGSNTLDDKEMAQKGKIYQEMLPVEVIHYTPPVAVMFILDRSGSMTEAFSNGTRLDFAKNGALECLNYLSIRDWAGLITFEDGYSMDVNMIPMTRSGDIIAAIDQVKGGGGTNYAGAFDKAGEQLNSFLTSKIVQRAHIIVISDGEPGDPYVFKDRENQADGYGDILKRLNEETDGAITASFVCFNGGGLQRENMQKAAEAGGGNYYEITNVQELSNSLRSELLAPEIKEYVAEPFTPRVTEQSSILSGIDVTALPELGGFYGVDIKEGASAPLYSTYAPLYASWRYGAGRVGSFMCDLNGKWSNNFLTDENGVGKQLIHNIIRSLFPAQSIRAQDIEVSIEEQNYVAQMNIYTDVNEGEMIEVTVTSPNGTQQTLYPSATEGFSRLSVAVTTPGRHTILVEKKNADGVVLASCTTYRTLSYSADYDAFVDSETGREFMEELATRGNGVVAEDVEDVFASFKSYLEREFNPTILFCVLIAVMFLLDIAVRKFKFKWIHEMVRNAKRKREQKGGKK